MIIQAYLCIKFFFCLNSMNARLYFMIFRLLIFSRKLAFAKQSFSNTIRTIFCRASSLYKLFAKIINIRPNKKISVFWVKGLKILGRVGTNILFYVSTYSPAAVIRNLKIWNIILPLAKCIKIYFFSRKPEKNSRFH